MTLEQERLAHEAAMQAGRENMARRGGKPLPPSPVVRPRPVAKVGPDREPEKWNGEWLGCEFDGEWSRRWVAWREREDERQAKRMR